MIDTFQVATQGVGPGWSTFSFATQGFGFEAEVIVRPVEGGGGGGGTVWIDDTPYEIIVRVKYHGKTWEQSRRVSGLMGKSLEKVVSSFKRISKVTIQMSANLNNIVSRVITIKAWRRRN